VRAPQERDPGGGHVRPLRDRVVDDRVGLRLGAAAERASAVVVEAYGEGTRISRIDPRGADEQRSTRLRDRGRETGRREQDACQHAGAHRRASTWLRTICLNASRSISRTGPPCAAISALLCAGICALMREALLRKSLPLPTWRPFASWLTVKRPCARP